MSVGVFEAKDGFWWARETVQADGTVQAEERGGPFPAYSAAFEAAALERGNAGQEIDDWRDRPEADLLPAERTETVESPARVVEAGPADGVVPLHDEEGAVLPGHEGGVPSSEQGWPFDARVEEHPGTGEPMVGVEVPADGSAHELVRDGETGEGVIPPEEVDAIVDDEDDLDAGDPEADAAAAAEREG